MKLAFQIAWRFLSSAKRQTLIIILGISVGVSVQVFIGSLIAGLQDSLVNATIGSAAHITLRASESSDYVQNSPEIMTTFESNFSEITVSSPTFDLGGTLEKGLLRKEILLRGFDFAQANQIYGFDLKLLPDSRLPQAPYEIVLGKSLGEPNQLDLELGDSIEFFFAGQYHSLVVVGFFDFNVAIINRSWGITLLETNQSITGSQDITSIEFQIKDVFEAENLSPMLLTKLVSPDDFEITNWMGENQELLSGLQGQSTSSLMIQVFVIISVVLGISSTLAITVLQKSKQIGILKAMGIKDSDASKVFLFEGFILGIFGAIGGIILGLGLSYAFTTFALNPEGEPVVPLLINPSFILLSAAIALFASTLAALIPAIKSSKMTVIEVIRNA